MSISNAKNFLAKEFYAQAQPEDSYYLMRRIFALGLGALYFNIFCIYLNQAPGLYSSQGLLPYRELFAQISSQHSSSFSLFWQTLSLFALNSSDFMISLVGWIGLITSVVVLFGYVNFPILFLLWILQMSIVHAGQIFYGYGWETQILELTFLSFFLFPFLDPRLNKASTPPKKLTIILLRWMMFRLMLGAGLIKIRGDNCWWDLTCTFYHYETQPNPHPLSWYLHHLPDWFHRGEVLWNHFIELILPFAVFGPKVLRRTSGVLFILFQVSLILSGNLAWLNWITLVMAMPCFDDRFLSWFMPQRWSQKYLNITPDKATLAQVSTLVFLAIIALILSYQPAMNLISDQQMMNTSYNRFHLINSYGAFGSIGKTRNEIIISGTTDREITSTTKWREYEFKCKPGDVERRPCLITPYHYRIDWQIWFSAMRSQIEEVWLLRLAIGFLKNNQTVLDLIAENPFSHEPPKWVKMELYEYHYTGGDEKSWWTRKKSGEYMPPLSLESPLVQKYQVAP